MKRETGRREFIRAAGLSATTGLMAAYPSLAAAEPKAQGRPNGQMSMGAQLRQLLQEPGPMIAPGFYDVLSARLAAMSGFKCVFQGGSIASEQHCIPDIGLITMTEFLNLHERTTQFIPVPVIIDVDDLGGNPLSVYRNTKQFERIGLGGVYFEDVTQASRVRYGSDSNTSNPIQLNDLLSKEQMVQNIRAAADARSDLVLCVNCYAYQKWTSKNDMERAIERGLAYAEAGADVLSFGGRAFEQMKEIAERVQKPLWWFGTGLIPPGVKIVIFETPLVLEGAALRALTELRNTGGLAESNKEAMSREDRERLAFSAEYEELSRKYPRL
jgi:2-methylisocitrate lyase-like PEP mutase family enzyme